RAARLRHRHGVPHGLWLSAVPRRADVLRRSRPVQRRSSDGPSRRQSPRRPGFLEAGAAARAPCSRRQAIQLGAEQESNMTEAVIVSTARTPLAKSWRGAFNMTHGATLGAHVVQNAVSRAGIEPAEVEDVIMGCAHPEGATGANIARQIALRAG